MSQRDSQIFGSALCNQRIIVLDEFGTGKTSWFAQTVKLDGVRSSLSGFADASTPRSARLRYCEQRFM
jgi:hypothetical protein